MDINSRKYLDNLKQLTSFRNKWKFNDLLDKFDILSCETTISTLPESVKGMAKGLSESRNNFPITCDSLNESLIPVKLTHYKDNALKLREVFYELRSRWELINNIKETLESSKPILTISNYYHCQAPVYLQLLSHVRELHIAACSTPLLRGITYLENLEQIRIINANPLIDLSELSLNHSVKRLIIEKATRFTSFSGIEVLTGIEEIEVSDAAAPIDMGVLVSAINLKSVKITYDSSDLKIADEIVSQAVTINNERLAAINAERRERGWSQIQQTCFFDQERREALRHANLEGFVQEVASLELMIERLQATTTDATTTAGEGSTLGVGSTTTDSGTSLQGRVYTTSSDASGIIDFHTSFHRN